MFITFVIIEHLSSYENCTIVDDYNEECGYVMHVNCIEDTLYKLKTLIPVLKMFVNLTLMVSSVLIVTMINVINGNMLTQA